MLLPQLLFFQEEETLLELAERLSTDLPQLLKKHFSTILAHLHPLRYIKSKAPEVNPMQRFEKIWNLIKRHVPESERNTQISKELDNILIGLLSLLTHGDSNQVPPNGYEQEAIGRTIRYLMKLFGRKTEGQFETFFYCEFLCMHFCGLVLIVLFFRGTPFVGKI